MLGLALIIAVRFAHLERGLWTVIGAHALLILPVVTFIVLVRLEGVDRNLELAATDLGANRVQTFLRIVVPQAMPAVVAATLIGFALSMDEFIVTFLVTGHDATLPLFIYSSLHYQSTPELNALSALMLGGSFLLCGLAAALLRRSRRGRGREGGRDGTGA
jgi:ABC-type spermidine/putrescine transport system permease subunit II